jgi:AcrR family transcriptional regulator
MSSPLERFSDPAFEVIDQARERRDAAEHRQQILAAAAVLFAERGVSAVTMDEIARVAGVGKGTLYRRYANKGRLCLATLEACWRHFQDQTVGELTQNAEQLSALDRLELFLQRLVGWIEGHVEHLAVMADAADAEERGAACRGPIFQWAHHVVANLLTEAIELGAVKIDDPVYTADVLLAALDVHVYAYERHYRGYSPEQIHRGLCQIIEGLRAR